MTPNFQRSDFACKCGCGFDTVDYDLALILERLGGHFERRVIVTSGCRCPQHNAAVGGSPRSQHLFARASDVVVEGIDPGLVYELLDQWGVPGLGRYKTFTHVDTRTNGPARWGTP